MKPEDDYDPYGPDVMQHALMSAGITPKKLAKSLKAELEAMDTKFFASDGIVVSQKDVVAWGVRQKARMDAHAILNHYPAKTVKIGNDGDKPFRIEEVGAAKEQLYSEISRLFAGSNEKSLVRKPKRRAGKASAK